MSEWKLEPFGEYSSRIIADNRIVAVIPGDGPLHHLECISNARLLVAAPELLEACEAVDNPEISVARTATIVRAAIAKATKGEQAK